MSANYYLGEIRLREKQPLQTTIGELNKHSGETFEGDANAEITVTWSRLLMMPKFRHEAFVNQRRTRKEELIQEREKQLAQAFSSVGLVDPVSEILSDNTMRFTSLLAKKGNGGLNAKQSLEYEALKAFTEGFIEPVNSEMDRLLGLLSQGQVDIEPNWPEYTATHKKKLETIVAIRLSLV